MPDLFPGPRSYRKKPVVIEAMQVYQYIDLLGPEDVGGPGRVWTWLNQHGVHITAVQEHDGPVVGIIPTLEGDMRADVRDWIIRGVAGEFYPCKPGIFEQTYEPVDGT